MSSDYKIGAYYNPELAESIIRTENENTEIYKECTGILSSCPNGELPVYFYFSNSKKYFPCKKINLEDSVLNSLKIVAGEKNVILQK